jgi:hypothetical protein
MRPPALAWHDWLEAQIAGRKTARAFAELIGVDESKLSRWRLPYPLIPQSTDLERLADCTKTPLPDILLMLWAVDKRRIESREGIPRPQSGSAGAVGPSPKSPPGRASNPPRPVRRGRRVLGLVAAVSSAWGLLGPLPGVEARPITAAMDLRGYLAEIRDSVALRRRWRLA